MKNVMLKSIVLVVAWAFIMPGCQPEEEEKTTTTSTQQKQVQETFTQNTSIVLTNSIIDLPDSLTASSSSSRVIFAERREDGGIAGIYSGITHYVSMAEQIKDFVKEIMTGIVAHDVLQNVAPGELVDVPKDSSDPDAPTQIMVEQLTGETYEWKVSLYFNDVTTQPGMIARFTIIGESAKGRILWTNTEESEELVSAGITGVSITRSIDVTFDATAATKTMEVKLVQDLTQLRTYAETNWASLSSTQKSAMDLGQPDKVFVMVTYDGTEFVINGTSWHPGWAIEASLNNENSFWGEGRSMYVFKAKAIEATTEGAKLYLALPVETTTDVSNIFTTDSVSAVFGNLMLSQVNTQIAKRLDEVDDADIKGTAAAEKQEGFYMYYWMLGSGLPVDALAVHGNTFTQAEVTAAAAFWSGSTGISALYSTDYNRDGTVDYHDFNTVFGTLGTILKTTYYYMTMAPVAVRKFNAGTQLTLADLESFIKADASDDNSKQSFQSAYNSIKYMINPAYYRDGTGFLGTYDETNSIFYKYVNNTLSASSDESSISDLKSLDLSSIIPYVPADVVRAAIKIE
ncbi:MAG: hypothetical protein HQM11_01935 [SAR324 cluster bacterium]|nr:hypothetical protein [SAR324 cluster bacterium]